MGAQFSHYNSGSFQMQKSLFTRSHQSLTAATMAGYKQSSSCITTRQCLALRTDIATATISVISKPHDADCNMRIWEPWTRTHQINACVISLPWQWCQIYIMPGPFSQRSAPTSSFCKYTSVERHFTMCHRCSHCQQRRQGHQQWKHCEARLRMVSERTHAMPL